MQCYDSMLRMFHKKLLISLPESRMVREYSSSPPQKKIPMLTSLCLLKGLGREIELIFLTERNSSMSKQEPLLIFRFQRCSFDEQKKSICHFPSG